MTVVNEGFHTDTVVVPQAPPRLVAIAVVVVVVVGGGTVVAADMVCVGDGVVACGVLFCIRNRTKHLLLRVFTIMTSRTHLHNYTGRPILLISEATSARPLPDSVHTRRLPVEGFLDISWPPPSATVLQQQATSNNAAVDDYNTIVVPVSDCRNAPTDTFGLRSLIEGCVCPTDAAVLVLDVPTALVLKLAQVHHGPIYALGHATTSFFEDDGFYPVYALVQVQ